MAKRGLGLPKARTAKMPAQGWKRLLAFLIDCIIIDLIIFFPFEGPIIEMMPSFDTYNDAYQFFMENPSFVQNLTIIIAIMSGIALLYFVLLERKLGQTPGKILLNLHVKNLNKKQAIWQYVVRSLFIVPVFPFILLWILDPIFLMLKQQRLSEIFSKTQVIEERVI